MAIVCARATRNAVSKLCNISKSSQSLGGASSRLPGLASSPKLNSTSRFSFQKSFGSSRLPVELGCVQSMMPLHNANASALFTSLLSLHAQSWGCLSEGFATPL